jgi:hypothetical protein
MWPVVRRGVSHLSCAVLSPCSPHSTRTSAVELERRLQLDLLLGALGGGVRLLGGVQAGDVRLVVLAVVQLHDLCRDVRFEGLRVRVSSAGGGGAGGRTSYA